MEIEHFSHEHRLILHEDQEGNGEAIRCACCDLAVSGPNYNCIECNYFLHESCAKLPRNTIHLMHKKHPLTLIPRPLYDDCKCAACHGLVETFAYKCFDCGFTIDIRCATLPHTIECEIHEHPFTLLPKSATFCCDACGIESEGISYLCTTCFLWVHPKCAALPCLVKNISLPHILYLTRNTNPVYQSFIYESCRICFKPISLDYWFYCCEDCCCIVHVACATSRTEPIRNEDVTSSVTENEQHLFEKIDLGDETVVAEVQVPSHQHHLHLCDVLPRDEKCDGCTRPILDPYYSCNQCKFSLHVSCAKLPMKLLHPLHPEHVLTLLPKSPYLNGIFRCEACTNLCNGFTYSCDECTFNLDVACSSIELTLKHDGHEHLLFLGQETSCEQCSSCGEDCVGFTYGCRDCNFRLDTNCATLPSKAKHWFHRHTLALTFSSIEDSSGEYLCDACEKPRNPNYWFYYCADCDLSAHLSCMRGEYPYIKFGGTKYETYSHPHLLTLVQKKKDNPTCDACGYPCESLTFECAECKFNIHWTIQNSCKGKVNKACRPKIRNMYLLDKAVYMMTHDARKICQKERRSTNLKHLTHDHFLTLGYVRNKKEICNACKLHLEGPCYQCQKCNIYLHKKCAEAPPIMLRWDDPQHSLYLNIFKWPQHLFKCNLCDKIGENYGYQCKDCNLNLHVQCAFTPADKRPSVNYREFNYSHICEGEINPKSPFDYCVHCGRLLYRTGNSIRKIMFTGTR